jgi:hypothetical protein
VEPCVAQGEQSPNVIFNVSILVSLNLAWLNDCFKASAFAITRGFGNAADGAGASISFPTAEKAKSSH